MPSAQSFNDFGAFYLPLWFHVDGKKTHVKTSQSAANTLVDLRLAKDRQALDGAKHGDNFIANDTKCRNNVDPIFLRWNQERF